MTTVFFSYSHADEALRDQLETQLAMLKRQGVIETWHDRRIGAGEEWADAIDTHVETDDIILLLVSPDFLASDYCYDREMSRAMERHEAGEAIVIPIILRACDWQGAPFGKLQAVPRDGKPVTLLPDRDLALLEVAKAVRVAAERMAARNADTPGASVPPPQMADGPASAPAPTGPRLSELSTARQFTEHDKDTFRIEAFEFMAHLFETSIAELQARNPGTGGTFRRIDANRFTAAIYHHGRAAARCTVFIVGGQGSESRIAYAQGESTSGNSFNDQLSVNADDESMFLRSLGFSFRGRDRDEKLTLEGAAQFYWDRFIEPLRRS